MKIKSTIKKFIFFIILIIGVSNCTNTPDFNGTYATELCPYFEYTNLNPSITIYMEGGKQFIEFNGATYIGEMEDKKLNFFKSPDNIPFSLEKNENGQFVLLPYQCIYKKI